MSDNSRCYHHPEEVVVGVCPLCLNEKLVILAAKQKRGHHHCHHQNPHYSQTRSSYYGDQASSHDRKQPTTGLPRIFALGSFFNRLEFRHWKSDAMSSYHDASSSPEDSFISIRFEDNGLSSWEKNTASKVSFENCKAPWNQGLSKGTKDNTDKSNDVNAMEHHHQHAAKGSRETKSVIEHAKPRATLRWRRRIGHLFHLIRWKRSSKGNVGHVDAVKVRNGWIRTLTRRKTKE